MLAVKIEVNSLRVFKSNISVLQPKYMRNVICALTLLLLTATAPDRRYAPGGKPKEFPEATITNGLIEAHVYLPDTKDGYYRGARFDWAGVVSSLVYNEHSYFGQWFEHYSPTLHDAIMGPVDAFYPVGFDEAKPGDSFLKIGIGTLLRPDDKPYHFSTPFEIQDYGKWKVKRKKDQVEFVHEHVWKEYGYVYTKILRLEPGKPELTLLHTLKNTGSRVLETNVYNHNFFVIDQQPTGPDFTITFPFPLAGEGKGPVGIGELQGNSIVYNRVLAKGENFYCSPLLGFGDSAKDNQVTIENRKTGAGVKISCDLPIARIVYWSAPATVCPEPYSNIRVAPGEEISWKNVYEFYILPAK